MDRDVFNHVKTAKVAGSLYNVNEIAGALKRRPIGVLLARCVGYRSRKRFICTLTLEQDYGDCTD
jgi:hypothetical protein